MLSDKCDTYKPPKSKYAQARMQKTEIPDFSIVNYGKVTRFDRHFNMYEFGHYMGCLGMYFMTCWVIQNPVWLILNRFDPIFKHDLA